MKTPSDPQALDQRPTILGASVAGLLVSAELSRAGLAHVMVGPPTPPDAPRLGESIDIAGSLELCARFPHLMAFAHRKDCIALHSSAGEARVFSFIELLKAARMRLALHALLRLPRSTPWTLHLDRYRFDAALLDERLADPLLTHVDAQVEEVLTEGDRVAGLRLSDGQTLRPSHAFDAANHARLLGRAFNIELQPLGNPKRTAFARYDRPPDQEPCELAAAEAWRRASHLFGLTKERDGVTGIAWCLPMPDYVSVGLSLDEAEDDGALGGEALIDRVAETCAARGVPWRARYPVGRPAQLIRHRSFTHARVSGEGWMMVGGSAFTQHLASSGGFTSTMAMAMLAPEFVRAPRAAAPRLEAYVRRSRVGYDTYEELRSAPRVEGALLGRWIQETFLRSVNHAALCSSAGGRLASGLLWPMFTAGLLPNELFGVYNHHMRLPTTRDCVEWMGRASSELRLPRREPDALASRASAGG